MSDRDNSALTLRRCVFPLDIYLFVFITEKGENVFFSCCAVFDDFEVLLSVNMRCRGGAIQTDEWVRVSHTYFSIICEALPRASLVHWFWLCLKPADSIECVAESQPRGPAVEFSDGQRQIIRFFFFLYWRVSLRFTCHAQTESGKHAFEYNNIWAVEPQMAF